MHIPEYVCLSYIVFMDSVNLSNVFFTEFDIELEIIINKLNKDHIIVAQWKSDDLQKS